MKIAIKMTKKQLSEFSRACESNSSTGSLPFSDSSFKNSSKHKKGIRDYLPQKLLIM